MDNMEQIDKIFSDKRFTNAIDKNVQEIRDRRDRVDQLTWARRKATESVLQKRAAEADVFYTDANEKIRAIQRERDKAVQGVYDRYAPDLAAAENEGKEEIDKLFDEIRKLQGKPDRLVRNRMKKVLAIVQADLEGSPVAKGAVLNKDGMIRIDMKPIMVKRDGWEVYPTNGYIELAYERGGRQRIAANAIFSEGKRHPHGGCLNTKAYDLIREGRFADAVLDLAMALSVTTH